MLKSQISKSGFDGKQKIKNISKFIITAISVTVVVFLSVYSCKDKIIGPGNDPGPKPGRRDYVWTVDTLDVPFTYFDRIWGSSPNDVWVVGDGDIGKTIYHYNGEKWTNDGIPRLIIPYAIWGSASNDVWLAGAEGGIWHYNGYAWSKYYEDNSPEIKGIVYFDIFGDSPNSVYAVGYADIQGINSGVIYHFNGSAWQRIDVGISKSDFIRIKREKKTSNNYYVLGSIDNTSGIDTTKLLEFDGKKITEIYSAPAYQRNANYIQSIDSEMYFVIGYTVNKYIGNNEFSKIFDVPYHEFGIQIFGRSQKDIFLRMTNGIAHYNGTDVKYLVEYEKNISLADGIVFNEEVFFLANHYGNGLNLVYRGKLK